MIIKTKNLSLHGALFMATINTLHTQNYYEGGTSGEIGEHLSDLRLTLSREAIWVRCTNIYTLIYRELKSQVLVASACVFLNVTHLLNLSKQIVCVPEGRQREELHFFPRVMRKK